MKNEIIFIHSLNNYTGSTNVLGKLIEEFCKKGYSISLITSKTEGFLSNINKVKTHYTIYKWSNNKLLTFLDL